MSYSAKQKKIDIQCKFLNFPRDIKGLQETAIEIDEQRVQQVILNYLSNSLKFMDKRQGQVLILAQISTEQSAADFLQEASSFFGNSNFINDLQKNR